MRAAARWLGKSKGGSSNNVNDGGGPPGISQKISTYHERLDEHDERYFAMVRARNRVRTESGTRPLSKFRKGKKKKNHKRGGSGGGFLSNQNTGSSVTTTASTPAAIGRNESMSRQSSFGLANQLTGGSTASEVRNRSAMLANAGANSDTELLPSSPSSPISHPSVGPLTESIRVNSASLKQLSSGRKKGNRSSLSPPSSRSSFSRIDSLKKTKRSGRPILPPPGSSFTNNRDNADKFGFNAKNNSTLGRSQSSSRRKSQTREFSGPPLSTSVSPRSQSPVGPEMPAEDDDHLPGVILAERTNSNPSSKTSVKSHGKQRKKKKKRANGDNGGNVNADEKKKNDSDNTNESKSGKGGVLRSDENRAFEAMLGAGMVWADISRGGKVTCLSVSPRPSNADPTGQSGHSLLSSPQTEAPPLLLAIGTDDGFVSVMEILENTTTPITPETSSSSVVSSSRSKKRYGAVRELPREGKVRSLDFSPDGRYLAVGGDDCTAAVVDVGSRLPRPLRVPQDGASASWSDELSVNTAGTAATTVPPPPLRIVGEIEREDRVYSVRFSPDGQCLAVGGFDGMVAVASFHAAEGDDDDSMEEQDNIYPVGSHLSMDLLCEIPRLGLVLSVDWSPDGTMLAVGGSDKRAAIVDAGYAHSERHRYEMNTDSASGVSSLTSHTSTVSSGPTWEVIGEIQRGASVQCVRWSPEGNLLAVGGHDGLVAVVDIDSRSIVGEIKRGGKTTSSKATPDTNLGGDAVLALNRLVEKSVRVNSVCWSPDGGFIAVGGSDDLCAIVETKSFVLVHEIRRAGNVTCVDWDCLPAAGAAAGSFLAVGGDDRSVAIIKTCFAGDNDDVGDGTSIVTHSDAGDEKSITSASTSNSDWVLREDSFRDMDEGVVTTVAGDADQSDAKLEIFVAAFSHKDTETGTCRYMAVSGSDGRVSILSTDDWMLATEMTFSKPIRSLQFSKSNDHLALGGDDCVSYIISLRTWNVLSETTSSTPILSMGFSSDDQRLAIGTADGLLTVLQPSDDLDAQWEVVGEMDTIEAPLLCLDWSPEGSFLALGRGDAGVSIHDSGSIYSNFFVPQTELKRRGGAPVHTLSFGPLGKFLAVGGGDWTVAVYSAKGGWNLCHELKTDGWVLSLGWSVDGRFLGMGGTDLSKGGTVVDTISWEQVEELGGSNASEPGVGIGEEVTSVDWSNDGRWFVVAGKDGVSRVVNTKSWEIHHKIDHRSTEDELDMDTTDELDAKTRSLELGTNENLRTSSSEKLMAERTGDQGDKDNLQGNEHRAEDNMVNRLNAKNLLNGDLDETGVEKSSLEREPSSQSLSKSFSPPQQPPQNESEGVPWNQRKIIISFLNTCRAFLPPYETDDPPSSLRLFVSSVLMLQLHVTYVGSPNRGEERSGVERQDEGKLLLSLLHVLVGATKIMKRVLTGAEDVETWWDSCKKFDLTVEILERLNAWNNAWNELGVDAPTVDIDLLKVSDL